MSVWIVEVKEFGYRPFRDGEWELYPCVAYGTKHEADMQVLRLAEHSDEYTHYRAVEYVPKDGTR